MTLKRNFDDCLNMNLIGFLLIRFKRFIWRKHIKILWPNSFRETFPKSKSSVI